MPVCPTEYTVYVGSYATEEGAGISILKLDAETGTMNLSGTVSGDVNPSFLTVHPTGNWLYAVNEVDAIDGQPGGALSAYAIKRPTGELTKLGRQSTLGKGPCHVSIDVTGRFALVANYRGGGVTVIPILSDGSLGPASDYVQHQGHGPNLRRQEGPHVHSVLPAPGGQFIFVADLGLDRVQTYMLDPEMGRLHPLANPIITKPGAGPRHFTFSSDSRFLYLFNELDSTISTYNYAADSAETALLATVSALPADYTDINLGADLHLHPYRPFLYGTNRGHDSLVVYRIDEVTGTLTYMGHTSTLGSWPRHFSLDPSGRLLLVANQKSDSIVSFWVDTESGELHPTGHRIEVLSPVCVQIALI